MIDAFQTYKYFMSIKLHFTTDNYDVFESNGRISGSIATFNKRNDKFLFEKIGRKFDKPRELIEYLVSNFAYGNTNVIYSSESDEYFHTWNKRKESRTHLFKQQLADISNHLEQNKMKYEDLFCIDNNVPELLKLHVGGFVHLETIVILNDFESFLSGWEPLVMLWGNQIRTMNKIKKFVKYDKSKIESIYNMFKEQL